VDTPRALSDLDITAPGFFLRDDYHELLGWLRAHAPAFRTADGSWLVTRYDDIRSISRQPAQFTSRCGVLVNDPVRTSGPNDDAGSLLHLDPPIHAEHRKLLNRRFTPRAVTALAAAVHDTVDEVFGNLAAGDEIDAVERIAAPIPVAVVAELLGVDGVSRAEFRRWSDAVMEISDHPDDEQIIAAASELFGFLNEHVRARVAAPGDDLISMLVCSEVGGEPLSPAQVVLFCLTLLVAGNETTRSLLSGGMLVLAEHPEQRAALAADESLLAGAIEELLRWVTPIQAFCRTATAGVEVAGTTVPVGGYVVMLYASGNRDETIFGPTAGSFDITRPATPAHVAFGFGEHLCLGASLARLEAEVVFTHLLRRFPEYGVTAPPTYVPSTLTRSIGEMAVRLA
jgi:cytochrome P450